MAAAAASGANNTAKTVARAWVQLKPSLRTFFTETNRELSSAKMTALGRNIGSNIQNGMNHSLRNVGSGISNNMQAAGLSAGTGFGNSFGTGFHRSSRGMFSGLTNTINSQVVNAIQNATSAITTFGSTTAKVAIGATAALAGMTAVGGFNRAINIENAEAKLVALKHSAKEVSSIMNSALQSVEGTIYSLDGAASAAANAVASGIPQGNKLTNWLKLITDTATVANAPLDDVARILNRVQANGRAFTLELNMLADRGLPIFTMLAQETGQSMVELRKSIAAGEISVDTLANALQHKLGGAALASADTTKGAFMNMKISFSRFGAVFATEILPLVHDFFLEVRDMVDMLKNRFGPQMVGFAKLLESKFGERIRTMNERLTAFLDKLKNPATRPKFLETLKTVADGIYASLSPVIEWVKDKLPAAFESSDGIVTRLLNKMFVGTKKQPSWLTDFVTGVRYVKRETEPLVKMLGEYIPPLLRRAESMFKQLFRSAFIDAKTHDSWLGSIVTLLTTYIPKVLNTVIPIFDSLWKKAVVGEGGQPSWISTLITTVTAVIKMLWPVLQKLITDFVPKLIDGFSKIAPFIGQFLISLAKIATAVVTSFGPVLMDLFVALAPLIAAAIGAIIKATPGIITFVTTLGNMAQKISQNHELVQGLAIGLGTVFLVFKSMTLVIGIVTKIGGAVTRVIGVFTTFAGYLGKILGVFGKLGGAVMRFGRLVTLFMNVAAVRGFLGAIKAFFPVLGTLITGIGRAALAVKGWSIWTKLATAAQVAFNFVASMNPWVLLAIGIALVVAGLVWFFTQTEAGKQAWEAITESFGNGLASIAQWFGEAGANISKWWGDSMNGISEAWNNTVQFFSDTVSNVGKWFHDVFTSIGDWFNSVMKSIGDGLGTVGKWFSDIFNGIGSFFHDMITGITDRVQGFIDWVTGLFDVVPDWLKSVLGGTTTLNVNNNGGEGSGSALALPFMASGGDIMGPTAIVAGEVEPETIVNRGKMNDLITSVTRQLNSGTLGGGGGSTFIEVGGLTVEYKGDEDIATFTDKLLAELEFRSMR